MPSKRRFYRSQRSGMRFTVMSGNMYNAVAPFPYVLVMQVMDEVSDDFTYPYFVSVERGGSEHWIRTGPLLLWEKDDLDDLDWDPMDDEEVSAVHNALFRILSND